MQQRPRTAVMSCRCVDEVACSPISNTTSADCLLTECSALAPCRLRLITMLCLQVDETDERAQPNGVTDADDQHNETGGEMTSSVKQETVYDDN
jgi:hypothetical protein